MEKTRDRLFDLGSTNRAKTFLISSKSFCFLKSRSVRSAHSFFFSREGLRREESSFWRLAKVGGSGSFKRV